MFFACNTTVTVFGPYTTYDEWGDEVDADVVVMAEIPASITEQVTRSQGENSTRPFVTREAIIRVPQSFMSYISQNCRIRDDNTNTVWIIEDIMRPNNAFGHQSPRINVYQTS